MNTNVIGERLQRLREEKRPTPSRRVASELCGLPHDALRRYERGVAIPRADVLSSIADFYEVSVDYILGRTDVKCPSGKK